MRNTRQETGFWDSLGGGIQTTRTISQFSQAEIIIPNGPYQGQYYSVDTQPFIRHYFAAIESRQYQRFAAVGPTQSGKTLSCSVIPTLWHLFECRDDVVYGAPTIEIAKDKWTKDFKPVIDATRYRAVMPLRGTGARGGTPTGIDFLNGASLRFMTGGGSDKTVAGYTARAITITEVDGMDNAKETSREADRISQLEVRGDAFGLGKRVYLECTASIETGRIWQEYLNGTHCVLIKQCPYCSEWVTPEREHIRGWQDIESERAVVDLGHFVCPACEHPLTPRDRVDMMHGCQTRMDNPDSLTYSFRWNAFDNLFWTPGEIALDEWRAKHKPEHDKENAIKVQHQFKWALPYDEVIDDSEPVIEFQRTEYTDETLRQGIVPAWAELLTVGVDVHAKLHYWTLVAWKMDGTSHIVDYGRVQCPYKDHGQEKAVKIGLVQMTEICGGTWVQMGKGSKKIDGGIVDARWLPEAVRDSIAPPLLPGIGFGTATNFRRYKMAYREPDKATKGGRVIRKGDGWHMVRKDPGDGGKKYIVVNHDSDAGKSFIHRRLATPAGQPGAMTLYHTTEPDGHSKFLEHINAEKQVLKKGTIVWETTSDQNHWFDATVRAAVAAQMLGVKVTEKDAARTPPPPKKPPQTRSAPNVQSRY